MAVTFGYYTRAVNPVTDPNSVNYDPDAPPYLYTLLYELSPMDILTISVNQPLNANIAVAGDEPIITPMGITAREVTIHGKFTGGKSNSLQPNGYISDITDELHIKEGGVLRVHKDPKYGAIELVNFSWTAGSGINLASYPYYTGHNNATGMPNGFQKVAYWTIDSMTTDQKILQKFGRYEFDMVLSYNWLWQGETMWRF